MIIIDRNGGREKRGYENRKESEQRQWNTNKRENTLLTHVHIRTYMTCERKAMKKSVCVCVREKGRKI